MVRNSRQPTGELHGECFTSVPLSDPEAAGATGKTDLFGLSITMVPRGYTDPLTPAPGRILRWGVI